MSRSLVRESLILLLIAGTGLAVMRNPKIESLDDGSVLKVSLANVSVGDANIQQLSIAPSSNVTFNVTNVSSETAFFIVQVHTYQYNVTLSYDKDHLHKVSNSSVFGSNIGLYVKPGSQIITQMYLKNDNVHRVDAIIAAIPYGPEAPVPGGCNMEFNTEIAPYGRVTVRNAIVLVDIQPASVPINDSVKLICEKNPVEHEMYQMYLTEQDFNPESYFVAIVGMLTVDDIRQNGRQVLNSDTFSPMRRAFSAYTGTGSVYVAVAKYNNRSAAYVPTFSYACNPVLYPESCQVLNDILPKLICAGCFFLGLFSVFQGYKFLMVDRMLPILFTGTVVGYMCVVAINKNYESSLNITIALGIGATFALIWYVCYNFSKILGTLFFTLTLGFFVACIAYFRSPDSFVALENDWVFWTLFCTFVAMSLIMTVLLEITYTLTCSIYSAYMMVLPIDYYAGSTLKYIIINVIRRATVEDFEMAIVQPPVQTKDVCLIVLWVFLALYHFVKLWLPGLSIMPAISTVTERTPLLVRLVVRG